MAAGTAITLQLRIGKGAELLTLTATGLALASAITLSATGPRTTKRGRPLLWAAAGSCIAAITFGAPMLTVVSAYAVALGAISFID